MEPEGGRAERIAPLPRASEAAITKVPGRCSNTTPAGTARKRPLYVTRLSGSHILPRPGASRTGPLFYSTFGTKPEA